MSDSGLGGLTEADVKRVAHLVESLDRSTFDYLQVEIGDLKLTIARGAPPVSSNSSASPPPASIPPRPASPPPAAATPPPVAPSPPPVAPSQEPAGAQGTVPITAPTIGVFYAQPEPGAPPFVSIGTRVEPDTTVGLVEVMKTFNAVAAGTRGTIADVRVENAQFVEYGQVLFRLAPDP